jgi:hypothetical protein
MEELLPSELGLLSNQQTDVAREAAEQLPKARVRVRRSLDFRCRLVKRVHHRSPPSFAARARTWAPAASFVLPPAASTAAPVQSGSSNERAMEAKTDRRWSALIGDGRARSMTTEDAAR